MWLIIKAVLSAAIIVAVSEIAPKFPRIGALLLSLPVVSLLTLIWMWHAEHDVVPPARLARETLILVPLGLPAFLPLAFSDQLHLSFWPALIFGICLATITIGGWFRFAPTNW
jgi:hypothetical protein